MAAPLERYKFTVDDYSRMAEAGVLQQDARVELIDGEIVMMTPIGLRHSACADRVNRQLVALYSDTAIVRVQNPIVLSEYSEPQPDFAVLRPRADFYASGHPRPADLLLAIEVADSSIGYDRGTKLPLYGRSGIADVWIVDLVRDVVDAYRQPFEGGYAERRTYRRGQRLPLPALAAELAVDDILP
ncbi:MAG TPA: Uma2 family endonuclease [Thermoanaerobaculia bacterium]|jgi:Uma2 family endonuclease|nr:Uma2 family endonuclease [Thermoanaerobaculia bacterium]